MMHEDGGKNDLEIEQLKGANGILNERLNARTIALDETLQRLADADCSVIKPSENKASLDLIEKSIQDQFNNMQVNF